MPYDFFFIKEVGKRPFVWGPECCPCAMVRGEALSPGGGAYSPTDDDDDDDENDVYDYDYDDDDDDDDHDDNDDDDDDDSCCKTLSSAAKSTFGFC